MLNVVRKKLCTIPDLSNNPGQRTQAGTTCKNREVCGKSQESVNPGKKRTQLKSPGWAEATQRVAAHESHRHGGSGGLRARGLLPACAASIPTAQAQRGTDPGGGKKGAGGWWAAGHEVSPSLIPRPGFAQSHTKTASPLRLPARSHGHQGLGMGTLRVPSAETECKMAKSPKIH